MPSKTSTILVVLQSARKTVYHTRDCVMSMGRGAFKIAIPQRNPCRMSTHTLGGGIRSDHESLLGRSRERPMNRVAIFLTIASTAYAHDVITTKVTFDREIVRLFNSHCISCHRSGGQAFSLATYEEARPWAKAIGEEVLRRRMPPWGAVKGFGDFRDDQGLTPEQLELIVDWEEGGAPEGDAKDIPQTGENPPEQAFSHPAEEIMISGDTCHLAAYRS